MSPDPGSGAIFVEVVVATSIDGRISTPDRHPWRWSDPADHAWLLERMAAADLLVVGAGTIRAENPSLCLPGELASARQADGRSPQPARLVLTPSLSIEPEARIVSRDDARLLVAARGEEITRSRDRFPSRVEFLEWRKDLATTTAEACERIAGARVLCLGGGRTNGAFLQEDLVDRISHTVSGFAIGASDAPGPFEGLGFGPADFPQFRLDETRRAGRDVILVWTRDRSAAPRAEEAGLR